MFLKSFFIGWLESSLSSFFIPATFKKFQKMIEKKIIIENYLNLTRCYYGEFSDAPDENIKHDEKMELRSWLWKSFQMRHTLQSTLQYLGTVCKSPVGIGIIVRRWNRCPSFCSLSLFCSLFYWEYRRPLPQQPQPQQANNNDDSE